MEDREAYRKKVGSRLRKARENAGYTQSDIQKIFKYKSCGTISQHESGIRLPDPYELYRMAQLYEVDANWLFGKEETENDRLYNEIMALPKESKEAHIALILSQKKPAGKVI